MGIRENFTKNKPVAYGGSALLVLLAAFIAFRSLAGNHGNPPGISERAFFTTEDQLTGDAAVNALFIDNVHNVPPFDHNGKPAYRAYVFVCNGGRTKWVNHLKRYTPEMKKRVEAAIAQKPEMKIEADTSEFDRSGTEMKQPGPGPWLGSGSPGMAEVSKIHIPQNVDASDIDVYVP